MVAKESSGVVVGVESGMSLVTSLLVMSGSGVGSVEEIWVEGREVVGEEVPLGVVVGRGDLLGSK